MKKKYFGTWIYKLSSLVMIVILLFGITGFSSCSKSGDDDSEEQSQVINKDIVGVWYCVLQQLQDGSTGDKWTYEYEPSSQYMIGFDDDGTGYMNSGRDALFEIWCTSGIKNFNWYGYRKNGKNYIHTDVYERGQDYEITSISSTSLTLTWRDYIDTNDCYNIDVCTFVKMK